VYFYSGGGGKSLWDAARDIVASREQGKLKQYIFYNNISFLFCRNITN
jgi:hypothetical protein